MSMVWILFQAPMLCSLHILPTLQTLADGGAAYHVADRTESAGTQSSYDVEAIAKQAAASWRAGRAADGSAHPNKSASAAQNGGRSGGSTARKYVHEGSGGSQNRSGRALRHLSSMATSVHIRNSLALREQRVVHASRDPVWCVVSSAPPSQHICKVHSAWYIVLCLYIRTRCSVPASISFVCDSA